MGDMGLCFDCRAMASLEQQRAAETGGTSRGCRVTNSDTPAPLNAGGAEFDIDDFFNQAEDRQTALSGDGHPSDADRAGQHAGHNSSSLATLPSGGVEFDLDRFLDEAQCQQTETAAAAMCCPHAPVCKRLQGERCFCGDVKCVAFNAHSSKNNRKPSRHIPENWDQLEQAAMAAVQGTRTWVAYDNKPAFVEMSDAQLRRFLLNPAKRRSKLKAFVYDDVSGFWFDTSVKVSRIKIENMRQRRRRKLLALSKYDQATRGGTHKRTQRRRTALKVKASTNDIQHANGIMIRSRVYRKRQYMCVRCNVPKAGHKCKYAQNMDKARV